MARQKGTANLATSLEILMGQPLVARTVVQNLTDIMAPNFTYKKVGIPVVVQDKGEQYIY